MADLLMILVMVAFIVICVGYVAWCDRVIGPSDPMSAPMSGTGSGTMVED